MEKPHSIVPVNVPCAPVHAEKNVSDRYFYPKNNEFQISEDQN